MLPPRQQQALELQEKGQTVKQIAKEMGISHVTVKEHLKRAKANKDKFTPVGMPEGFSMPKTTVQYKLNEDGEYVIANEWRRLIPDADLADKFVAELCQKIEGKGKTPKFKPKKTDTKEHLFEIAINDAHLGMYAWGKETGDENYSTDIGANRIIETISELASYCRPAETHLVINGDFMHSDNRSGTTEKSGHILDMDSRFSKIARTARAALTTSIDILCEISPKVHVHVLRGNHDPTTGDWFTLVLDSYYRKCENVIVDPSPASRRAVRWGEILLAWAHGDKTTMAEQAQVAAAAFRPLWGETKRGYFHLAHKHHKLKLPPKLVDEKQGIVVEYLTPLCSTDSFAAEHGYIKNLRGAEGFLYNRQRMCTRWPVEW